MLFLVMKNSKSKRGLFFLDILGLAWLALVVAGSALKELVWKTR